MSKSNDREKYFYVLSQISKIADKILVDFWKKDKFGDAKKIIYEPFLRKKIGSQKQRTCQTYLSYCAFTGEKLSRENFNEEVIKLGLASELELWAEYCTNWIVDNKGRILTDPKIRKKIAIANKSFLEDALRISFEVGNNFHDLILDGSRFVTNSFTKEFVMDRKETLDWKIETYLDLYRNEYAVNGIGKTYSLGPKLVARYLGIESNQEVKQLEYILDMFGRDFEILNDLGDFCLSGVSTDKRSSDQFADIRNGTITPPIWLLYNFSEEIMKKRILRNIGNQSLNKNAEKELIILLFESGTFDIISKGLQKSGRIYKRLISKLNFHNEGSKYLQISLSSLESNKIYHTLKDNYKQETNNIWNSSKPTTKEVGLKFKKYLEKDFIKVQKKFYEIN